MAARDYGIYDSCVGVTEQESESQQSSSFSEPYVLMDISEAEREDHVVEVEDPSPSTKIKSYIDFTRDIAISKRVSPHHLEKIREATVLVTKLLVALAAGYVKIQKYRELHVAKEAVRLFTDTYNYFKDPKHLTEEATLAKTAEILDKADKIEAELLEIYKFH